MIKNVKNSQHTRVRMTVPQFQKAPTNHYS